MRSKPLAARWSIRRAVIRAVVLCVVAGSLAVSGTASARSCIYNPIGGAKLDCRVRSIADATGVYASSIVNCARAGASCSSGLCIYNPLSGEPNCNLIQLTDALQIALQGRASYQQYVVQCIENESLC